MGTSVRFRVEARLEQRLLAIDLIAALVKHVKTADDDFRDAITTAFGEAFNNVVIHGYKDRTDGMLDVEADLGASHMTLRLLDTGRSADLTRVPTLDLDEMVEGGMGVFMIHRLVDEVRYSPGSPNVLSLTKRTGR
ncbi:MAG: ATP-binding protein [Labilithrix sp.]|nr:ATP-binding protein [Labilithrix sp.]MCW5811260.1 ATP-binding protein [Labilithrix sp.]